MMIGRIVFTLAIAIISFWLGYACPRAADESIAQAVPAFTSCLDILDITTAKMIAHHVTPDDYNRTDNNVPARYFLWLQPSKQGYLVASYLCDDKATR